MSEEARKMTIEELKKIALFSCRNDSCREEVSYPQDMLRKDPETGEPVCEACWGEDRWVGHASEDYTPVNWGDLEPYTPIDDAFGST